MGHNHTHAHHSLHQPDCGSQEESLSLVFTVGMAFFGLTSFPVGWIFDKFGLKITRLFAALTGSSGYLLLAFANKEVSWLLFPGMALVATSCITLILTNTYIGRMAGKKSSTVITLYAGSISSSVGVFLAVKLFHDAGIGRKIVLSVLAAFWIPTIAVTCFLLPSQHNGPCRQREPKNKVSPNREKQTTDSTKLGDVTTISAPEYYDTRQVSSQGSAPQEDVKPKSIKKNATPSENLIIRYLLGDRQVPGVVADILSLFYILYIYWYCALHVRVQFFISQFNIWVGGLVNHDQHQVSHFTNVLGYAMLSSIIISPLGGMLIDSRRSLIKDMAPGRATRSIVAVPSLVFVGFCSVGLCLLVHADHPNYLYAIVVFAEIFRSFFYATGVALLELSFPREHYGRLFGLARSISGVMSFLQYPYVLWANTSTLGLISVKIFLLLTVLVSLALPIYSIILYIQHRRQVVAQAEAQKEVNRY